MLLPRQRGLHRRRFLLLNTRTACRSKSVHSSRLHQSFIHSSMVLLVLAWSEEGVERRRRLSVQRGETQDRERREQDGKRMNEWREENWKEKRESCVRVVWDFHGLWPSPPDTKVSRRKHLFKCSIALPFVLSFVLLSYLSFLFLSFLSLSLLFLSFFFLLYFVDVQFFRALSLQGEGSLILMKLLLNGKQLSRVLRVIWWSWRSSVQVQGCTREKLQYKDVIHEERKEKEQKGYTGVHSTFPRIFPPWSNGCMPA